MDKKSNVVIIGNSPKVLDYENGSLIDSFDTVIRINNCPTAGFEKFIGEKINIWATTKNIAHDKNFYPLEYDSTKRKCILPHENIPSLCMSKNQFFDNNFHEYDVRFRRETNHEFCTGMLTILTSTLFFKNVNILGFDFYQSKSCKDDGNYAYYINKQVDKDNSHFEDDTHDEGKASGFVGAKVAKVKKEILNDLAAQGKINFLD